MNNAFLDAFNLWLDSKKSRPQDTLTSYPFLKLIQKDSSWEILYKGLDQLTQIKTSFSEGIKIIELISEIILIREEQLKSEFIMTSCETAEQWIKYLNSLRYPLTTKNDLMLEKKMMSLEWPFGSKVKFERRGDRSGVELKVFITSPADLIKLISSLERVQKNMNTHLNSSNSETNQESQND